MMLLSHFHLSLHVLLLLFFFFLSLSLYTLVSYLLYAIFYFCFTLKCFDEFCIKIYHAMNSLPAKFFKSLY